MFSLTLHERILVAAILLAVVLGVSVEHWRDARREASAHRPAVAAEASTAARSSASPRLSGEREP